MHDRTDAKIVLRLVNEYLSYDDETGLFYWKKTNSNRTTTGTVAGTLRPDGYISIVLDGNPYKAHILVWLIHTGEFPKNKIDHEDRNRKNNRFRNLRDFSDAANSNNGSKHSDNSTGLKGIAFDPKYQKKPWRVQISRGGKVVHRSHHLTRLEASEVAQQVYTSLDSPHN